MRKDDAATKEIEIRRQRAQMQQAGCIYSQSSSPSLWDYKAGLHDGPAHGRRDCLAVWLLVPMEELISCKLI